MQTRYQCAVEHGVSVVTPDWILDCDTRGARLPESSYHPSLLELEEQQTAAAESETLNGPSFVGENEENFIVAGDYKENIGDNFTEPLQNKTEETEKCFPSTSTEEAAIESNNHLELKPHAWSEDSTSSILEGITFYIIDYPQCVGEETIEKWKKVNNCIVD